MPPTKRVTMADVADRADVSKSTVSAVVNGRDIVKDSTRDRVLDVIQELNYRPSGAARRGYGVSPSKSIGFVIKEAQNPYYAEVQDGIHEIASEKGYLTFVSSSEGDFDEEREIVKQCSDKDLSGLIITPILDEEADLSHIFNLKRNNIPFVLLERVRGLQASLVDIDNTQASCDAAKHLIDLGHKRIVHFSGPDYSSHSEERVAGIRQAFSESTLVYESGTVLQAGDAFEDGYRCGHAFFEDYGERAADERVTGVTCYNDLVALGLMSALRELGIDVPGDVSVVGFDDIDLLEHFPTSLTTIRVPRRELGRVAATMLVEQVESGGASEPRKVSLDASLVARTSTAPPS